MELGAIKLDQELTVTYANPAAKALLGGGDPRGRNVYDFFVRSEDQESKLAQRKQGKAAVYSTWIVRPGRHIPVSVAGTPILDSYGHFRGTLGIVRNLEVEQAKTAIQKLLDSERDATRLLTALARKVLELIKFDGFTVNQYSKSGEHVSMWFSFTRGAPIETCRRWWPIPEAQQPSVGRSLIVPDLDVFIRRFPDLQQDPNVRRFLDQQFHSMLRIPVYQENRVIASLMLLSREPDLYRMEHGELLKSLLAEQAVRMALYYRALGGYKFRYNLFKALARCRTDRELARLLVSQLAAHYGWGHISISKPLQAKGMFRILAEASVPGKPGVRSEARKAPLTAGVRGFVYQNGTTVRISDRQADERFRETPPSWPFTKSELSVPVRWDGQTRWILQAEDDRVDAFCQDEQEEVAEIVEEAQFILRRLSRQFLLESTLASTSDAVLTTDTEGTILETNQAVADLLGYERDELKGPFESVFSDRDEARRALESNGGIPTEVEWVRKSGSKVPVLLSGTNLPGDLSLKVFMAKNLTMAHKLESLAALEKVFQDVAVQTHTPLALVVAWVRRAAAEAPDNALYPKILAQLKRMEISYKRLALSVECFRAPQPQLLDLSVEFKRIRDEYPKADQEAIDYDDPGELPYVSADPGQLAFALATILLYATRRCGGNEACVRVTFIQDPDRIGIVFHSQAPSAPDASAEERRLSELRLELALGEKAIREFAAQAGASYTREQSPSGVTIELGFPIARR